MVTGMSTARGRDSERNAFRLSEERVLLAKFGTAYEAYAGKVRRWL